MPCAHHPIYLNEPCCHESFQQWEVNDLCNHRARLKKGDNRELFDQWIWRCREDIATLVVHEYNRRSKLARHSGKTVEEPGTNERDEPSSLSPQGLEAERPEDGLGDGDPPDRELSDEVSGIEATLSEES